MRKQFTIKSGNGNTNMNPRQTEHDLVKEFDERYSPFASRPRSNEETRRAQDFFIWEDPASGNDDLSSHPPVSYSSDSLCRLANSHPRTNTSLSARTNLPDTARISEEDVKALDLIMARSTRYSIAYASDDTFNEDDEKDEVQKGLVRPSRVRNYSDERRVSPKGPRPPLVDITQEEIAAHIAKLNQKSTDVQLDPGTPAFALRIGRIKQNFRSSPLHTLTTVAEEYEASDFAASDNISEVSTEYNDGNTPPSKSSSSIDTALFHVSPYISSTPEQSRTWSSPGEESHSESYEDENQSLKELHARANPTECIITTSSSPSLCSETSKATSHRRSRSVAFSSLTITPPQKKPRRISPKRVQNNRFQPEDNITGHRRSPHTRLTVGVPVCYVDENNLEPPARTPLGMVNRIGVGHSPVRLFTPLGKSGIEGFWGDTN